MPWQDVAKSNAENPAKLSLGWEWWAKHKGIPLAKPANIMPHLVIFSTCIHQIPCFEAATANSITLGLSKSSHVCGCGTSLPWGFTLSSHQDTGLPRYGTAQMQQSNFS
jgi:hypothetical protein